MGETVPLVDGLVASSLRAAAHDVTEIDLVLARPTGELVFLAVGARKVHRTRPHST
jgi:hypothetical protein